MLKQKKTNCRNISRKQWSQIQESVYETKATDYLETCRSLKDRTISGRDFGLATLKLIWRSTTEEKYIHRWDQKSCRSYENSRIDYFSRRSKVHGKNYTNFGQTCSNITNVKIHFPKLLMRVMRVPVNWSLKCIYAT